ncbi:restriction endonuclease [Lactococcus sp. AK05]|uniref:restriction endonuclease n=1 Tax=Lactococcus sp. AK05 TaxID=3239197 RepID=UPI0034DF369E
MSDDIIGLVSLLQSKASLVKKEFIYTKEQSNDINSLIAKIRQGNFENMKQAGDALEDLTNIIFNLHGLYNTKRNLKTNTNEIDLFLRLTDVGFLMKENTDYYLEEDFLVECKNYTKPVGVTYIGKFASLMRVSQLDQGIFISKNGLTGGSERKRDSKGLIKKIALKDGAFILDFSLSDFENLEGKSLQEILFAKRESLRLDVDFEDLIEHHELEPEISN